jgi:DNA/RNA endonuclease YhcR with UshA esterase domain
VKKSPAAPTADATLARGTQVCSAIGDVRWRQRVRVTGRVRSVRVQPWEGGVATLECTLVDETGGLTVIFMGRRQIAGVHVGGHMEVEGMVLEHRGMLAIMNPGYTLRPS